MSRKQSVSDEPVEDLAGFACPNEDCGKFNIFGGGNLSVCERMGRGRQIRRLYCSCCGQRFSERQGTLLSHTKLSEEVVVRIVKCLGHGCSIEAAADICEVDPRSVALLLAKSGRRAQEFHRQALEKLPSPPAVVEIDELHAHLTESKKGELLQQLAALVEAHSQQQLVATVVQDGRGFI